MATARAVVSNDPDEMVVCPICKSSRYLNPDLSFVINPECYHKMCTSCVDRLFTSGPAPCPVAGCHKTLRKRGFHQATFADLTIEREVDVRKKVGRVFNRREEEFETLRDWNDYLETVEDLVFEMTDGTLAEKRAAEERLRSYREEYERDIKESAEVERVEREIGVRKAEAEVAAARRRREEIIREEEETKVELKRAREGTLDALARGTGNATKITELGLKRITKKVEQRKGALVDTGRGTISDGRPASKDGGLTIRGLKKKTVPVAEKPYDAFGGIDLTPKYYLLQDEYSNEWLRIAKNDDRHKAGGYSMKEYYGRTMFEAFSGMSVFIEDEKRVREHRREAVMATIDADNTDDVF